MKSKPKNRILERAKILFYEQGYSNTGINQILSDSNSAKASFYGSYPSKEDLAKTVLRSYQADILKWMRKIYKECDSPDKFISIFSKAVKNQIKNKNSFHRGCPIALISTHFPVESKMIRDELESDSIAWKKLISKMIKQWDKKKLLLQKGNEEKTAMMILNSYQGALIMYNITNDESYVDILKEQLKRIII
jgi:AcrR family transcriptional regulator